MLPLFRARNPPCSNSPARASTVLQTLVVQSDFHPKAAVNFIGEVTCARGERLLSSVHIQRQADDDRLWLPLFKQFFDNVPVRFTILCLQRRKRACGTGDALTDRNADTFGSEIKTQQRSAHYACPAMPGIVTMSIPISFAASRQRSAIGVLNKIF